MATKAFSYLRFSTAEQERGDSFRRQRDLAVRYCAEHGLELDGRSFHDLGISGYRGKNARKGALRAFLRAIDDGAVRPGEYLLVESLDRVSRQEPWEALPIFQQIVNAGVTVVTLQDRRVFSKAIMKAEPFRLIESLVVMIRAHEESEVKAKRLRAMWEAKRAAIAERPMTARCPAWLTLEPTPPRKFQVDQERAAVIRRIFALTLAGVGQESIARLFNGEGVPTFGGGTYWQRSYICKVLGNPAVVGDFQPHVDDYVNGKRSRQPRDMVRGYYPAVVDRKTFEAVQTIRADKKSTPRVHGEMRSLVAGGLAKCPRCGDSMTRVSKASLRKASKPYLSCSRKRHGGQCDMPSVPFDAVEQAIIGAADEIAASVPSAVGISKDELAGQDRKIASLSAKIKNVIDAIEAGDELDGHRPEPLVVKGPEAVREQIALQREGAPHRRHLVERLRGLEGELSAAENERRKLAERIAAVDGPTLRARLRELNSALSVSPFQCARANVALRALFSRIVVDLDNRELLLHWHFGGLSAISFNPKPVTRAA